MCLMNAPLPSVDSTSRLPDTTDTIDPVGRCPLFGTCGGCSVLDLSAADYVAQKAASVAAAFAARGLAPDIAPVLRAPFASRRRATLTAVNDRAGLRIGFLAARSHDVVDVPHCPALDPALGAALPAIREIAAEFAPARIVATLCHNGIDVAVTRQAGREAAPRGRKAGAKAQARRAPITTFDPAIVRLTVDGDIALMREPPVVRFDGVDIPFPPASFLQASRVGEAHLTRLVIDGVAGAEAVADLYCGLGTFAVPLTRTARVTAVEVDGPALAALERGMARTEGRRLLTPLRRNLMRDPLAPKELAAFDAVVFDPPRAGAETIATALAASAVPRIVAVSCEPRTLARDCAILVAGGYKITHVVPVDQFVGTRHIEAVATLRRD